MSLQSKFRLNSLPTLDLNDIELFRPFHILSYFIVAVRMSIIHTNYLLLQNRLQSACPLVSEYNVLSAHILVNSLALKIGQFS